MKSPAQKLEDAIPSEGWELEEVIRSGLDRWALEIWKLQSIWPPEGFRIFVTFLVAPESEWKRRSLAESVRIGASAEYPGTSAEAESLARIAVDDDFRSNLPLFLDGLDKARVERIEANGT